jgi:hypothetical protein
VLAAHFAIKEGSSSLVKPGKRRIHVPERNHPSMLISVTYSRFGLWSLKNQYTCTCDFVACDHSISLYRYVRHDIRTVVPKHTHTHVDNVENAGPSRFRINSIYLRVSSVLCQRDGRKGQPKYNYCPLGKTNLANTVIGHRPEYSCDDITKMRRRHHQ